MKIAFISDFFIDEFYGGAEIVDSIIINHLKKQNCVDRIKCSNFNSFDYDLFIVSNFLSLKEEQKKELKNYRYFIIEHDHKFLKTRDSSKFNNNIAPADQICNSYFYRNAELVFCQSKRHSEILIENLILDNVVNFGCSFWTEQEFEIIKSYIHTNKEYEYGFLNSSNPIKGSVKANRFCLNKEKVNIIQQSSFDDLISEISKCNKFVFFPQVYESFCRLAVEAKMLNCSIITNKNFGCFSEDKIKDLKGKALVDYIENKQEYNLNQLDKAINKEKLQIKLKGLRYPKISLITSMYKGEKYIKKFLNNMIEQTVFQHCELLIIDAVSPENEYEIIKGYIERYSNIKYIRLEKDPGIYGVWNIGAKMATGKYLTNTNLDDIRSPEQIEVMVNCLEKNPNIDLAYSESYVTSVGNETFQNNSSKGKTYPITDFSKPAMIKCLPGCMPVWRKSMHDKAGYFDESFRYAGDHEMWLRAVRNGSIFKRVEGAHGLYYMNPDGLSTSKANEIKRYKEEQRVFWEYIDIFGYDVVQHYSSYFSRI